MAGKRKTVKQLMVVQPAGAVGGKTLRNRRKRQRRARNRGAVASAARSSPKRMIKWPSTKDGANYLRGVLDPFSDISLRSVGVPDSFAGDTLKHVNTMEVTVTPINGEIRFTIIPSASTPLLVSAGSYKAVLFPTVDSATLNPSGTVSYDLNPAAITPAIDIRGAGIPWPSWASALGGLSGSSSFGPYDYKSQRVVSMGLEWRYTGTTLTDKGVCTAAMLDAYKIPGYVDTPTAASGFNTSSAAKFLQRADVANLMSNTQVILSNQPRFVQQSLHDAEGSGGMIVLVSDQEGVVIEPTNANTMIIDATGSTSDFTSGNVSLAYTYTRTSGIAMQDAFSPILPWQNLRPVGVAFTGLDADTSIVLKLKQRVEATVTQSSPFQQFTDKSPAEDANAMCIVADVQKTLPVMVPVTMNAFGDWWRKIMSTISSAGKIIGGIGLPFASPIAAGVGGIADILGSFAQL